MRKVTKVVHAADIFNRLLEVKGISTTELCKRSGISRNTISNIRNNRLTDRSHLQIATARALTEELNVPIDLFYKAPYFIEIEEEEVEKKCS